MKDRLGVYMRFHISDPWKAPLRRWYLCVPSNYGRKESSKENTFHRRRSYEAASVAGKDRQMEEMEFNGKKGPLWGKMYSLPFNIKHACPVT